MRFYLVLMLSCLSLFLAACGEKAEEAQDIGTAVPQRFTILPEQITSWSEDGKTVHLVLDGTAVAAFASFTDENKGKKVDIYLADKKLMSPEIRAPATSADIYLTEVEEGQKEAVLAILPPDKKR